MTARGAALVVVLALPLGCAKGCGSEKTVSVTIATPAATSGGAAADAEKCDQQRTKADAVIAALEKQDADALAKLSVKSLDAAATLTQTKDALAAPHAYASCEAKGGSVDYTYGSLHIELIATNGTWLAKRIGG